MKPAKPKEVSGRPKLSRRKFLKIALFGAGAGAAGIAGGKILGKSPVGKAIDRAIISRKISRELERRKLFGKKFSQSFLENRNAVSAFIKANSAEIIRKAGSIDSELGGVVYISKGRLRMDWIQDKGDLILNNTASQLRSGDVRKISLKDFDYSVNNFENIIKFNQKIDGSKILAGFQAARKRILLGQQGKASAVLSPEELAFFRQRADFLEEMAKASYGQSAKESALRLSESKENKVLATFHTHAFGSMPEGSDLEGTVYAPEIVFSFQKNKMDVYYIIDGKRKLEFSVSR